jgi:hypothetical protein
MVRLRNEPESKNFEDRHPKQHRAADFINGLLGDLMTRMYYTLPHLGVPLEANLHEQNRKRRLEELEKGDRPRQARVAPVRRLITKQREHLDNRAAARDMARNLAGQNVPEIDALGNRPEMFGYGHYPDMREGGYDIYKRPLEPWRIQSAREVMKRVVPGKGLLPEDEKLLDFLLKSGK